MPFSSDHLKALAVPTTPIKSESDAETAIRTRVHRPWAGPGAAIPFQRIGVTRTFRGRACGDRVARLSQVPCAMIRRASGTTAGRGTGDRRVGAAVGGA